MIQSALPLWNKVIFVDWHGVLSRDPFWMPILNKQQHPLHQQLSDSVETLFSQNNTLICDWMRGKVKASEIVDSMDLELQDPYNSNYLVHKLIEDCQLMRTNAALINILRKAQNNGAFIVLATDNMDCFFEQIQRSRNRRRSQKLNDLTNKEILLLKDTVTLFDDVLCSSELGILKREDPMRFFEGWLKKVSLNFQNSFLLDDLEENCAPFRAAGGTTHRITYENLVNDLESLDSKLQSWIQ